MGSTIRRKTTIEDASMLGLNKNEFEAIQTLLGRTPNYTETVIYGELWSEESSFKNSIKYLSNLPTAKSIDLGNGTQFRIKIETNNTEAKQTLIKLTSFQLGSIENEEIISKVKDIVKTVNQNTTVDGRNVFFNKSFNNNPIINTFSAEIIPNTDDHSKNRSDFDLLADKIAKTIANHLDIDSKEIKISEEKEHILCAYKNEIIASLPTSSLTLGEGTPIYDREYTEPSYLQEFENISINDVVEPDDLREVATYLLKNTNTASKRWFNNQIGTRKSIPENTSVKPVENTNQALAFTVTCNPRYVYADPAKGTSISIAEAARKIICAGATPKAISTVLNFGNPYNPETYWQFVNTIKGMAIASEKFNTPLTDKSVSFNNVSMINGIETPILPSPTIGIVGVIENKDKVMTPDFKHKGDLIFIIGEAVECIASSEYLYSYHNFKKSPAPYFNLEKEYETLQVVRSLIQKDLINAAHDCSRGGLFITLTEMSMSKELGFDIVTDAEIREDAFLFGEASGRIIVGVNEDSEDDFIEYMMNAGVNYTLLGHVTQGKLVVDDIHYGFIQAAKTIYNTAIEKTIG